MPIRFDAGDDHPNDNGGGGSGGGGFFNGPDGGRKGIFALLALLFFFFRYPKLTLFVLVVGGGYVSYQYPDVVEQTLGIKLPWSGGGGGSSFSLGLGCSLNQAEFDKAEVFEPLAANGRNSRPRRVSLRRFAPRVLSQGSQGSCVGWSSAYGARTILEAAATGKDPNRVTYSPAFLYNIIALPGCEGAYMRKAMETMRDQGNLPLSAFPYDERSCSKKPSSSQLQEARNHTIRGFNRLTISASNYAPDIEAIKQNLAQGAPVLIGMHVPPSFTSLRQAVWTPTSREARNPRDYGGHAMCVIGYDDDKEGGAFEVYNSWSDRWGDNGICWVSYTHFKTFCDEAYGLYPHAKSPQVESGKFAANIGLVTLNGNKNIPLVERPNGLLATANALPVNTRFRVEVSNSAECYVYIFGQETDGTSYVLFPYTEKHSAYCGIVGTRLFPRDGMESLRADDQGSKDYMAVVLSKQKYDHKELNQRINKAKGRSYQEKVNNALRGSRMTNLKTRINNGVLNFEQVAAGRDVAVFVMEINKK